MRTGQGRQDEPVDAVLDGPSQQLGEGKGILLTVGASKTAKVFRALCFVDDRRRVAAPDQHEIEHEPAGSAIPVQEGMNALESRMSIRQVNGGVNFGRRTRVRSLQPVRDQHRNFRPGRRGDP